jgi:hypothetical protein
MPGDYLKQQTRVLDTPDANGHLRHYGLDVVEKIRAAGFGVVTPTDMSVAARPLSHSPRRHRICLLEVKRVGYPLVHHTKRAGR